MIRECKECKTKFEGTYNALYCYDCRIKRAKDRAEEYQKTYRRNNGDKIKKLQASYHTDHAHASGYF